MTIQIHFKTSVQPFDSTFYELSSEEATRLTNDFNAFLTNTSDAARSGIYAAKRIVSGIRVDTLLVLDFSAVLYIG